MAIDMFTIPAMSDEHKRAFSRTGNMVTPLRNTLTPDVIGAVQCLESWQMQGVIDLDNTFEKAESGNTYNV